MPPQLPAKLMATLGALAIGLLALSLGLEATELQLLQDHPILTNLMSGVIGFSTSIIVVGVILNHWAAEELFKRQRAGLRAASVAVDKRVYKIYRQIPMTWFVGAQKPPSDKSITGLLEPVRLPWPRSVRIALAPLLWRNRFTNLDMVGILLKVQRSSDAGKVRHELNRIEIIGHHLDRLASQELPELIQLANLEALPFDHELKALKKSANLLRNEAAGQTYEARDVERLIWTSIRTICHITREIRLSQLVMQQRASEAMEGRRVLLFTGPGGHALYRVQRSMVGVQVRLRNSARRRRERRALDRLGYRIEPDGSIVRVARPTTYEIQRMGGQV